jgi:hypothetical protein
LRQESLKEKSRPEIIYAVWYSVIAITARVSVLLGCRSSSKIVNRPAAVVLDLTTNSSQRRLFLATATPFTLRCIVAPQPTRCRAGKTWDAPSLERSAAYASRNE